MATAFNGKNCLSVRLLSTRIPHRQPKFVGHCFFNLRERNDFIVGQRPKALVLFVLLLLSLLSSTTKFRYDNFYVVTKVLNKCKKCDWMAFKSQLLNFSRTDSNAIFSIVFANLFYIKISKPFSYLSDKTKRNKL